MHEHNTIVPLSRRSRLQKNQEQRIYDSFQTFRSKVEATARYIEREQETLRKNLKSSDHYFDSHIKRIEDLIRKISNIAFERFNITQQESIHYSNRSSSPAEWLEHIQNFLAAEKYDYVEKELKQAAAAIELKTWEREANLVFNDIKNQPIPIFSSKRDKVILQIQRITKDIITRGYIQLGWAYFKKNTDRRTLICNWHNDMDQHLQYSFAQQQGQYPVINMLLPAFAPAWMSTRVSKMLPGRPIISLGYMSLKNAYATRHTSDPESRHEWNFSFTNYEDNVFEWVLFLDLDEVGGLATNDIDTVKVAILDLLSTMPAGRVIIEAFDPEQLGNSLSFLFGLGAEGKHIYGDMVYTNSESLDQLLRRTEQHISFVIQKYLQGRYKSITDYNTAAGEVAEPYRILVLFDFPKGFSNTGKWYDRDLYDRISRIAALGRRAGVFVFVVTNDSKFFNVLPWLPYNNTPICGRIEVQPPNIIQRIGLEHELYFRWSFTSFPLPSKEFLDYLLLTIRKNLQSTEDVQVNPNQVTKLALRRVQSDTASGLQSLGTVAEPSKQKTWWQQSSINNIVSLFGRMGADDVATLRFDCAGSSSAVVGGRTGMGKSVLLHSIIASLIMNYSPEELELYLIDLKEGVEFKPYAENALPHARVVAIESDRELALSVLEGLNTELRRRGNLFRKQGANVNLDSYRTSTANPLPRILLIIDEFQVLFEKDNDQISTKSKELLERVLRQGRAFGIHTILASQSLSGSAMAVRPLIGQIANRIVLGSTDSDSQLLLADDNTDAQLLTKPGEGILNTKAGVKEANTRFQATYWTPENRKKLIQSMAAKAKAEGYDRKPRVFEGNTGASLAEVDSQQLISEKPTRRISLLVGMPMSLSGPVSATLTRNASNNVVIVGSKCLSTLAIMLTGLVASGIETKLINFISDNSEWDELLEPLEEAGLNVRRPTALASVLKSYSKEARSRIEEDNHMSTPKVLILAGAQRAKRLNPSESDPYDYSSHQSDKNQVFSDILHDLLYTGPEVGIHTIMTFDKVSTAQRRLLTTDWRELGLRIAGQMSTDDSSFLIDSLAASELTSEQLIFEDFNYASSQRVRGYISVTPDEIRRCLRHE